MENTLIEIEQALILCNSSGKVQLSAKEFQDLINFQKTILQRYQMVDFASDTITIIAMRVLSKDYVNNTNKLAICKELIKLFYQLQSQKIMKDNYVLDALFWNLDQHTGIISEQFKKNVLSFVREQREVTYE